MNTIIFWFKRKHILPIYRIDVLKYARKHRLAGLCLTLDNALEDFDIWGYKNNVVFPLFSRENAKSFGANGYNSFWWEPGVWNTGRLDFLDWLIEQYKDDKTDLRKL